VHRRGKHGFYDLIDGRNRPDVAIKEQRDDRSIVDRFHVIGDGHAARRGGVLKERAPEWSLVAVVCRENFTIFVGEPVSDVLQHRLWAEQKLGVTSGNVRRKKLATANVLVLLDPELVQMGPALSGSSRLSRRLNRRKQKPRQTAEHPNANEQLDKCERIATWHVAISERTSIYRQIPERELT
jgi:hypothetical protein